MSKEKQQASQKCPKCELASPATEDLSEYEKECSPEELEALEKKAAAMYGFDLEGDRRLDAEFRERRRKLRDPTTARCSGSLPGMRWAPPWNSRRRARLNRFLTWLGAARLTCSPANGPTTPAWRFAWAKAWCNAMASIRKIRWSVTCAGGEMAT